MLSALCVLQVDALAAMLFTYHKAPNVDEFASLLAPACYSPHPLDYSSPVRLWCLCSPHLSSFLCMVSRCRPD